MKELLKRICWFFGFHVRRSNLSSSSFKHFSSLCQKTKVDYVIDGGANRGQFTDFLLASGFSKQVIVVEAHPELQESLEKKYRAVVDVSILPPTALSSLCGQVTLFLDESDACHSTHESMVQNQIGYISTQASTLDQLLADGVLPSGRFGLKLDIQGAELDCLKGARNLLPKCSYILLELALEELSNPAESELLGLLYTNGFKLIGVHSGHVDQQSMTMLQVDCIFESQYI